MTRMIVDFVEYMARKEENKMLKYFNRKNQKMMMIDVELVEGVHGKLFSDIV